MEKNMKRIVYCVGVIAISLLLFSCKSSKVEDDGLAVQTSNGNGAVEIEEDEPENKKEDRKTRKAREKAEKEAKELAEKQAKEEAKKQEEAEKAASEQRSYLGWVDAGVKNPVYEDGIVKIKSGSALGTFGIFAVNEEGRSLPVISTLNEYSSTGFDLRVGRKKVELIASKNVRPYATEIKDGVVIVYDVKDTAKVSVKMNVFPSVKDNPADTIKFTVEIKNTGKKNENFALRAIFDTLLGENADFHFYDYKGQPVRKEFSSRNMKEVKWVSSKNNKAAMEIIVNGGDVTPPSLLALASYSTLEKANWEPNMLAERAFDTVLSYNNSAVGMIWPEARLEPGMTREITFYISLGLYGAAPTGHNYIYGIKVPPKVVDPVIEFEEVEQEVETQESVKVPVVVENKKEQKPTIVVVESPAVEEKAPVVEVMEQEGVPNVEFNIKKISKDHLTQDYINQLMKRITELEEVDGPVNRNEILQLNAELDAILSILRQ